jgi:hypothetical protein
VGAIDFARGASNVLGWLGARGWNLDGLSTAYLITACGFCFLGGLGLVYAFIKDVRPGRLTIVIGPIKLEYAAGESPAGDERRGS